jgi:hypothetical protein
MAFPGSPSVAERDGGLYVAGSGVSLDSVVIPFLEGADDARSRSARRIPSFSRAFRRPAARWARNGCDRPFPGG